MRRPFRRRRSILLTLCLAGCVAVAHGLPARAAVLQDDSGAQLELKRPARRIVTLAPFLAELAFAAGAGDRLVGVARYSDFPPAATLLPVVSDAAGMDFERILSLRPDLILAWVSGNAVQQVATLRRLGIPIYAMEPKRLADVSRLLRTLGTLAGTAATATAAANAFDGDVAALHARYAGRQPVRIFYEIWHRPLMTVNGAHLISDVLQLCGATNAFETAPSLVAVVSLESVLAARPAMIAGGTREGTTAFVRDWRETLAAFTGFKPRLLFVDPTSMQALSPRLLDGARSLCAAIDAERLAAAKP